MQLIINNNPLRLPCLVILMFLFCRCLAEGNEFSLVLENILPGDSPYDKVTPPKPQGSAANVTFHVSILSIDSVDSLTQTFKVEMFLAQTWQDSRLRLPDIGNQEKRNLPVEWLENLWRPDSIFPNAKSVLMEEFSVQNHYFLMFKDKTIQYVTKLTVQVSCPMVFTNYPHDNHTCQLKIESLSQTTDSLIFEWDTLLPLFIESLDVGLFKNPTVKVVSIDTGDCTSTRDLSKGSVTCLNLIFKFKRIPSFIYLHTFLPAILLVIVSWISFWIHPEEGSCRVFLGVAIMFALGWITNNIHKDLPQISYLMAIDKFLLCCTVFVLMTLIEFVILNVVLGHFQGLEGLEKITIRRRKSLWIDFVSRGVFPLAFAFFNIAYWCIFVV